MIILLIKIMEIPSTKSQISNKSQGPKLKIQNKQNGPQTIDKSPECLGHWTLEFGYCLEFGYSDLGFWVYDGCIEFSLNSTPRPPQLFLQHIKIISVGKGDHVERM